MNKDYQIVSYLHLRQRLHLHLLYIKLSHEHLHRRNGVSKIGGDLNLRCERHNGVSKIGLRWKISRNRNPSVQESNHSICEYFCI